VFLTPELKPFYGGTYFPPDNRHGRPGFLQLLRQIQQLWQTRRPSWPIRRPISTRAWSN
jgi:uncharacterized protein YyaL (SSP411 family)